MKKIISKSSFIFSLSSQTLGGFINNWWQNPQRALIFNYWKIINYITTIISSNKSKSQKEKRVVSTSLSYLHPLSKFHLSLISFIDLLMSMSMKQTMKQTSFIEHLSIFEQLHVFVCWGNLLWSVFLLCPWSLSFRFGV